MNFAKNITCMHVPLDFFVISIIFASVAMIEQMVDFLSSSEN